MTYRDPSLQRHVDRAMAVVTCRTEQRPVMALLDAWYWFELTEGASSPRVAEAIEHLLSAELRPALRQWYQRLGEHVNDNAMHFRNRLSDLAGEKFG